MERRPALVFAVLIATLALAALLAAGIRRGGVEKVQIPDGLPVRLPPARSIAASPAAAAPPMQAAADVVVAEGMDAEIGEEGRFAGRVAIDGRPWSGDPPLRIVHPAGVHRLEAGPGGTWSARGIEPGASTLEVLAPLGWQPIESVVLPAASRAQPVDFALVFLDASIVVLYPPGEAFRRGSVTLERSLGGVWSPMLSSSTEDESVLFEMMPAGRWQARFASDDGLWAGTSEPVEFQAGEAASIAIEVRRAW